MIQSLEDFVSMAIQGTQVPKYNKTHTIFVAFWFFNFFLYQKKNKQNWKTTKQNHVKQSKA